MPSKQMTQSTHNETITTTVIEKVADIEDVEQTSLRPLHDVIDPDALNAIFASTSGSAARSNGCVEFSYAGCDVRVRATGQVHVEGNGKRSDE